MEQQQIAEMVQMDLSDQGYPCHVENDGFYRVNRMKIQKLKIVSEKKLSADETKEFNKLKDELAKQYGKMRKLQLKEEKRNLKRRAKKE